MTIKVKDLTVKELQSIISDTVRNTFEDLLEDRMALKSKKYTDSIKQAREDYKKGRVKTFKELFDV